MKLLIASAPKTGNTWLRHLLAAIYELPMRHIGAEFNQSEVDELGDSWISHQHYFPQSDLLQWAHEHDVTIFTVVRHPCDALVSLYHYVYNYINEEEGKTFGKEAKLIEDQGVYGEQTKWFVREVYYWFLHISVSWRHSGHSHLVRYEDLWRDPVPTLIDLTSRLRPVSVNKIERAVEQCDISVLRRRSGSAPKFFRQGSVGQWREELPAEIVDLFRTLDPYPAQFSALGYTLEFDDPLVAAPAKRRPSSLSQIPHFDNGMAVPSVALSLYLAHDSSTAKSRWPPFAETSPDSFFAWLNAPAADDPLRETAPCITNLGAYLRRLRADVTGEFPDPFGKDRVRYIVWLLTNAQTEYHIDPGFLDPIKDSFIRWAESPAAGESEIRKTPMLTNLALYIYEREPELQEKYPDLFDVDRLDYLILFRTDTRIFVSISLGRSSPPGRAPVSKDAEAGMEPAGAERHRRSPLVVRFREKANQSNRHGRQKPRFSI